MALVCELLFPLPECDTIRPLPLSPDASCSWGATFSCRPWALPWAAPFAWWLEPDEGCELQPPSSELVLALLDCAAALLWSWLALVCELLFQLPECDTIRPVPLSPESTWACGAMFS
ncbi:MAG: hypothetical protein ACRDLP_16135, partial [Solirubrobacteraceae bacterium]